jgi:hemerythrin
MALNWNARLSTGLDWQDNQHQELFRHLNSLLEAMKAGHGESSIADTIKFIDGYVVQHFGNEERFMQQNRLTCYADHKRTHEEFNRRFAEMKATYAAGGVTPTFSLKLQNWLSNWWLQHIAAVDKEMATEAIGVHAQ